MSSMGIRTWARALAALAILLSARGAAGGEAGAPDGEQASAAAPTADAGAAGTGADASGDVSPDEDEDPKRLEFGGLPAINYDSDRGLGMGAIVNLARFHPGYEPYRWRLKMLLYATLKEAPDGGTEIGVHDDFIDLDMPGLMDGRLRIRTVVGFQRYTSSGYYGLGSASQIEEPWADIDPVAEPERYQEARRYHQYSRTHPYGRFHGRLQLWGSSAPARRRRLEAFAGTMLGYSVIDLYQGSLLAQQAALAEQDSEDGRTLARLLRGTDDHPLLQLVLGLLWDTRDHEYAPRRGTFSEVSMRAAPGVEQGMHFAGVFLSTRWYWPLGNRLVVAARGLGDFLVGNPPFYELTRFGSLDQSDGPGGGWSVRGVLRHRFHGKIKAIGNLELRGHFLPFRIGSQRFRLGGVLFADAGRVWADYGRVELAGVSLDSGATDFSVGVGGGLRVQWGETFVVRADPAWSLTEKTAGFYIDIGHIF